jgi:site-specific DNA-methyltransferase (adenine-specific)
VQKLPYLFKDPIKFDKRVDPRKLKFGSKIDNSNFEREEYYTVKEIISPEVLILNTGIKVRLLGVKEKTDRRGEAIRFLRDKTKGQKVFIRFDRMKYDAENNLLCYLYLWNKTFLNAHLIKNGLADTDIEYDFKNRKQFLDIEKHWESRGMV